MSAQTALAPLTAARKAALRPLAAGIIVAVTVFTGIAIALQVAILAPYPGTTGDPIMRTLAFTVPFALLATVMKVGEVLLMGGEVERRLHSGRRVQLKHVFNREIRLTAICGGALQAAYVIIFIALVPVLAPTALAAARACVIVALPLVELLFGVLPKSTPRRRLTASLLVTLIGSAVVIFANGFNVFNGKTEYMWILLLLIGPGNFALALAEYAEYRGVHKCTTAASVFTLARFVAYSLTCIIAMVAWGLLHPHHGEFDIAWNVFKMCVDRWYFLVPISLLWGITDLARICAKPVLSATYMYVVGSLSVCIGTFAQMAAKMIAPKLYAFVPGGWVFITFSLLGGAVIVYGAKLFPQEAEKI